MWFATHDVSSEKDEIGHVSCKTCISRIISILDWFCCGMSVWRFSFLMSLCFISLKQVQQMNLSYIASEKRFKTNNPTTCIQTSCRLLFASRLLEICRFGALLEYLTVAGFPAVVVTGMATQDWAFPVPPWFWWSTWRFPANTKYKLVKKSTNVNPCELSYLLNFMRFPIF